MNGKIKTMNVNGVEYIVQSYLRNDFANIVRVDPRLSFRIDLQELKVDGSSGKQDKQWKELASSIDCGKIKQELNILFPHDNKNL